MKPKIIKAIITFVVISGAITYLAISSFDESMIYYKTVEEVLQQRSTFENTPVRVNGLLKPGSIKQKPGTDSFIFQLEKNDIFLEVRYSGILPDTMTEGKELVVQGTLVPGKQTLNATEILTKCPSKYEKEAQNKNR